jgi:hypothetical protein
MMASNAALRRSCGPALTMVMIASDAKLLRTNSVA